MFGTDVKIIFETKIDKTYSSFLNTVKQNNYLSEALTSSVLDAYRSLQKEETFADISNLIRTNKVCLINNNQIYIWFLDITNISFAGLTVTVTTRLPHNIIAGDLVKFSDVSGLTFTPAVNGNFFTVLTTPSLRSFTFTVTAAAGAHVANTGKIVSHQLSGIDKLIPDFNYFLNVKQKYFQRQRFKVKSITNSQPIKITVDRRSDLRTGDYLNISGVVGNTNANGSFYIKKAGAYSFDLYYDKALTQAASGNGTFQGIPVINRIVYKVATPIFSSTKIDSFEQPSINNPRFERGDGFLKLHPLDTACEEITVDYVSIPPVEIDVTNSVIDLEDTYSAEFLYYVIDKAVNLFSQSVKDTELYQTSSIELKNA